eukprot:488614_1
MAAYGALGVIKDATQIAVEESEEKCSKKTIVWLLYALHLWDLFGDILLFASIFSVVCCDSDYGSLCGAKESESDCSRHGIDEKYCRESHGDYGYFYYSSMDNLCDEDLFDIKFLEMWVLASGEWLVVNLIASAMVFMMGFR